MDFLKWSFVGLEWLLLKAFRMNVYRLASWFALLVFCSFFLTVDAEAQNTYCVYSGATGSKNGSDWNNAFTDLPSSLVRGATYYVATGSYGSHNFNDAQSGTNLIIVRKATATDHFTATGWQSSYGIGQAVFQAPFTFNTGYYTIDGQSRTTMGSGHGIHLVNGGSQPINVSVGSTAPSYAPNVTLRYIEIEGSYSHGNSPVDVGVLSDNTQASGHGGDNLYVGFCYIHNVGNCPFLLRYANGITLEYNYVRFNNYTTANHCEAISSAEGNNNFTVRYNYFEDLYGSAWIYTASGADWPQNTISNWWIYGNVFQISYTNITDTANAIGPTDWGIVALISIACHGEFRFCNNTIVNLNNNSVNTGGGQEFTGIFVGEGYTTTADKFYVQNNLWINCNEVDALPQGLSQVNGSYFAYITNLFWDHNTYISTTAVDPDPNKQVLTSNTTNLLANWFSENDHLITNTAAGVTLVAPFNMDPDGNLRGADGNWDRGAYEFNSGLAGSTNPPVISGVTTSSVTPSTATIVWTTDQNASSAVQYGATTSYGSTVTNASLVTSHSVTLSGLSANSTYHYRVLSVNSSGKSANSADKVLSTPALDLTPPTVSLTAPFGGQLVSNLVTFSATATDNVSVAGVRFLVDGQAVGAQITSAPYSYIWNSASVTNGTHLVRAQAIDSSSNTATTTAISVQVQNILPSGLVGYWTFDEGSGTQSADQTGNGNTATLMNGATWGPGAVGSGSLQLDGVAAVASVPDSPTLRLPGNLSIALWVNHASLPTNGSYMYYLQKGQNDQDNYSLGCFNTNGVCRLFFEYDDTLGNYHYIPQTTGPGLTTGAWEHVAVIFSSTSNSLAFYVNGQPAGSVPATQLLNGTLAVPLSIGQQNIAGYNFTMNGLLDDVRIYNRTLTQAEVGTLYQMVAPPPPTGLRIVP